MEQFHIGRATITWLRGGVNFLDGGAMFGVVPKALWKRAYPNKDNIIELRTDPLLIQLDGKNYLVDTGMGTGKLTAKQMRNFGVKEESFLAEDLEKIGLKKSDIDAILMTHLHFDHASGLTELDGESYIPTFPHVPIYTSAVEWNEMKHPNIRSVNTYWEKNWKAVEDLVQPFTDAYEVAPGLRMIHTGGHSEGHSILVFEDEEECFVHMADLMPTHGHQHKLWALAYDDYPVTSVHEKEKWMNFGYKKEAWYTFYHDAYYRAIQFDTEGKMKNHVPRTRYIYET